MTDTSANPINIRLIDHVVIRVNDLDAMVRFYADVLGCRLEKGPGDAGLAQLRAGRSLIDLVDTKGPIGRQREHPADQARANMDHFCVLVQPWNEAAIRAHLERHGVSVPDADDRYGATGTGPSIYIEDPEGNTVELKGDP